MSYIAVMLAIDERQNLLEVDASIGEDSRDFFSHRDITCHNPTRYDVMVQSELFEKDGFERMRQRTMAHVVQQGSTKQETTTIIREPRFPCVDISETCHTDRMFEPTVTTAMPIPA